MKEIRNYIKRYGKVKARQKYGDKIDGQPIIHNGQEIGWLVKFWHPTYCNWTFKATVSKDGVVYSKIKLEKEMAMTWAKCKWFYLEKNESQFGPYLKRYIDSQSMSIDTLAGLVGCSRHTIYKWINGASHPEVHFLLRLCQVMFPQDWEMVYRELSMIIDLEK